ncbi:MAG TPA: alpha/beta hydrolase [Novosphingobium sp.]|nr:alpha/beta hydrolase [Novosphingobium sp.]
MAEFEDRYWTSEDGLRLHFRDYAGPAAKPPVVCIPGLTRNARDFEGVAGRLAGRWRVLCPDLRGRGDSAYAKDPMSYLPMTYAADIAALLDAEGIERFVAIGTSLGGLVTMLTAASGGHRIAGAVINDIGPEVSDQGIARIRGYVGQGRSFETWMHAARALEEAQADVFPDFSVEDWLVMAKRVMTLGPNGRIVFDYDMKIADPFAAGDGAAGVDLWPAWNALGAGPVLIVRGGNSDILAPDVAERMVAAIPDCALVVIPRVGHAPTLDEPEAVAAIERLLAKVA